MRIAKAGSYAIIPFRFKKHQLGFFIHQDNIELNDQGDIASITVPENMTIENMFGVNLKLLMENSDDSKP